MPNEEHSKESTSCTEESALQAREGIALHLQKCARYAFPFVLIMPSYLGRIFGNCTYRKRSPRGALTQVQNRGVSYRELSN